MAPPAHGPFLLSANSSAVNSGPIQPADPLGERSGPGRPCAVLTTPFALHQSLSYTKREMGNTHQFDKLVIRGFRGLSEIDIDGLGAFNILLGANDVGKTSILETIFLLTNPAEPKLPVRIQNWRNYLVHEIDDLVSIFHRLDSNERITISGYSHVTDESRTLEISSPNIESSAEQKLLLNDHLASRDDRAKIKDDQSSSLQYGSRVLRYDTITRSSSLDNPLSFSVNLVDQGDKWGVVKDPSDAADSAASTLIPSKFIGPEAGYDTDRIGKLIINKKDNLLVKYLREINPLIHRVTIHGDVAFLDIGLAKMMPLNMFGRGMIRAVRILSECIFSEINVLLVDEIEYGLHHRAIAHLLTLLLKLTAEQHIQVFVTTHSIDIVQALQQVLSQHGFEKYRTTTKCIALQRDQDGLVRSYRYDYRQFDHCITQNIEIR